MRNIFFFILSAVIAFGAHAQNAQKVVIGKIDSLHSTILNEERKIWIYTPGMTSGNSDSTQRYPVLYLLDGDAHFASVVGMIQQMSQVNGNTVFPEMIVVAIPNTDRTRDLTPTHIKSDPPMLDSNSSKHTGGGENFVAFIEKELMPHVDSLYPTQPYRTLVGHSFGGLIVMNTLINHTKLFNSYIAIDPSMWYDKERFLETTKKRLLEKKYDGTRLYLGIANTMSEGMTLEKMKKDTTSDTRHIRSIFELDRFLKTHPQTGLKYLSRYYANDNHGSVPLASEYDGLRFIFDYYRSNITGKDYNDTSLALVMKYKKHYSIVSKEMGFKVSPPEALINFMGYNALGNKHYTKAKGFFELNIANYPNSSNVFDSYGDLFATKKDTSNAIINYKKAVALSSNAESKQKIDALEGKQVKVSEQELQKFLGKFDFETIELTATIFLKDNALWVNAPGQGEFEMVPIAPNTFGLKNMSGYRVQFEMDGDKPVGLTSLQPNGIYKAHVKK